MKSISLKGTVRSDLGKKQSKTLRKQEQVPCVLYGGEENIHFSVSDKSIKNIVYTPNVYMIEFDLDGKTVKAVLKDLQFHPVTDKVLHADFVQVVKNKSVIVDLPVKLTGNSIGLINGGKLRLRKRYLKVKANPEDMPENLVIDITKIDIGGAVKVEDLSYDKLELLDPQKALVVGIVSSRLAAKAMDLDEGEEGTEEGTEEAAEATEEAAE